MVLPPQLLQYQISYLRSMPPIAYEFLASAFRIHRTQPSDCHARKPRNVSPVSDISAVSRDQVPQQASCHARAHLNGTD